VRRLTLDRWPPELDGLRVGVVGDVHAGAPHVGVERARKIAAKLAEHRPDLLLMAGDLVDIEVAGAKPVDPDAVAAALATVGIPRIAVLGNHDRTFGTRQVARALRHAGFTVLENEAERMVTAGGRVVWVCGVADDESGRPRPDAALAAVPAREPVIVLTHSPDVFPRIPDRVALTVAGHTHGGQVALPRLKERVIPSRFGDRYDRGVKTEGGRTLFVTAGVGTSRWPIRLGVPPEVAVLELASADVATRDAPRRDTATTAG
jgi:predicted MPP superfamily phosphohydrolase